MTDRVNALESALKVFVDEIVVPDRDCSCHLASPCNWCVEHSYMAEAVENARALLADKDGRCAVAARAASVSLRITGPNADGEYWLHLKNGNGPESAGINLGGDHKGMIVSALLKAAADGAA